MAQIDEDFQATGQHIVRSLAFNVYDEADATSVVLVGRVVKTIARRRAGAGRERGVLMGLRHDVIRLTHVIPFDVGRFALGRSSIAH
jgi:hypothetical protein